MSSSKRQSVVPRVPAGPKAPANFSSSVIIADSALLTGNHTINVSSESVINPRAKLDSSNGRVTIGRRCIVHERTHIGAAPTNPSPTDSRDGVTIQDYATVEVGATVEAGGTVIGEGTLVGVGCRVRKGAKIGKILNIPLILNAASRRTGPLAREKATCRAHEELSEVDPHYYILQARRAGRQAEADGTQPLDLCAPAVLTKPPPGREIHQGSEVPVVVAGLLRALLRAHGRDDVLRLAQGLEVLLDLLRGRVRLVASDIFDAVHLRPRARDHVPPQLAASASNSALCRMTALATPLMSDALPSPGLWRRAPEGNTRRSACRGRALRGVRSKTRSSLFFQSCQSPEQSSTEDTSSMPPPDRCRENSPNF
ncbi:hypothetical protein DL764_000569 [Monosporascus ibericus]|uniref:Dynactin subunit 6 n=1 Tax=Monosporascus ibericus TaxID=155417 RepID=A0A4V1XCQ8_9PEZI|nr:hypothetical protein DL764_000569 [Monosporascus ibericus]